MALFLKRIIGSGIAFNQNLGGLNLKRLLCFRCGNQGTFYNKCGSDVDFCDGRKILHIVMINHLEGFEKSTVIYNYKTEGFGITV